MCGFAGFSRINKKLSSQDLISNIKLMTKSLTHRGPDEEDYFMTDNICLGHKRLVVIDKEHGKQPMSCTYNGITYTIVYNGQLYNTNEIRNNLKSFGFEFDGYSDTEVILKAYIHYGTEIFKEFNGIFSFAIWNDNKKELVLCRDHFGIKPLFYSIFDDTILFASEIKSILKYPRFEAKIDKQGISELFGIGPAHSPGTTVFKNIYELKPAHFGIFNKDGFKIFEYWKMETKEHTENFEKTCEEIEEMVDVMKDSPFFPKNLK